METKKRKENSEYVQRPDLPQVRTWFDYRDSKWHRIWFNSKGTIKEEILDKEEDTYLYGQSDLYFNLQVMENNLEQLLNSLIEKGFRPFGKKADHCLGCRYNNDWSEMYKYVGFWGGDDVVADRKAPLRSLVSKESGLWQFVCENCLQVGEFNNREKNGKDLYTDIYYEYRLIESSLKDESELEDFLLQNIKVGN